MNVVSKEDKEAQLMGHDIGLRETPGMYLPPFAPYIPRPVAGLRRLGHNMRVVNNTMVS